MEYVPSKSLADLYHEQNGPMDPIKLLPILIQTARGLFVAHSHGVIHRDVKPANIMVSDSGEVKITDFGVSYSTNQEQITQDGMVVGTAQYISPEQAQGKHATPQSDIYSLGVVAYEGLCGHRPFTGATPVDIAAAHVNNPVPPLPDTVDVQLREFVMSMLAKDPLDRPKDALVVSRTLSRIERRLLDQQTQLADTMVVSSGGRLPRRVVSKPHISVSNDWKEQMNINMPTSLAGGRYQLGQLVGRGGMAEVHVATDTRLGRTVAVKIMRADFATDSIFLERFRREAHSVAQMNNPNIVNIYDSGEETVTTETGEIEHLPYLVMEYVKGQTLRDILKVNGALSQRDAEQVMMGVLNALEYSHRMGIIHRDIKPGNIMISEQGVVKVMDFGIARAIDDSAATMTQSQGVVGTAQYLSPEQARGESVDMRSDLYSAGCVLYEMLTGRPPFTGDSAVAIAYQHVSEVATPPSTIVPGLPKMWDSICAKAMAKDRQNRYATASEFKNDLLTFMNGGVPMAAAFNPLTDLTNMKARKQAEMDAATVPMAPATDAPTQAFNPVTGQFEAVPNPNGGVETKTRAEQRAKAAQERKKKQIIIASVVGSIVVLLAVIGIFFALNGHKNTADLVSVPDFTDTSNISQARVKNSLRPLV